MSETDGCNHQVPIRKPSLTDWTSDLKQAQSSLVLHGSIPNASSVGSSLLQLACGKGVRPCQTDGSEIRFGFESEQDVFWFHSLCCELDDGKPARY